MAGYLGTKAVLLSTTAADVIGNAEIGGNLTVGGNFTSTGIDVTGTVTADGLTVDGNAVINNAGSIGYGGNLVLTLNDTANDYPMLRFTGISGGLFAIRSEGSNSLKFYEDAGASLKSRMYIAEGGDISFYEDTGTTPKFFWDASLETLTLGGTEWPTSNVGEAAGRHMINYNGEPRLFLWDTSTGAAGNEAHLMLGGKPTSSATTISGGSINGGVENASDADGYLAFNTTNGAGAFVERMRLDSSGNVLIGCTSVPSSSTPGAGFEASSLGRRILALSSSSTGGGVTLMSFRNPNGEVGSIKTSGSSTSFNTSSDYRLKTDAQPMTGASARVQALNPVNFEWLSDGTRVDGFLAHEAQEIVPEAVTGSKDAMRDEEYEVTPEVYEDIVIPAVLDEEGNELEAERTEQRLVTEAVMGTRSVPDYQGIDQSKLVPLLTAALQEALTKIDDMETRLAALEAV